MRKVRSGIGLIMMLALMAACGGAAAPTTSPASSSGSPSAAPAASTAASPAAGAAASPSGAPSEVTIHLGMQSNSGESGTATLTAAGTQTKVVLNLTGQRALINRRISTRGTAPP